MILEDKRTPTATLDSASRLASPEEINPHPTGLGLTDLLREISALSKPVASFWEKRNLVLSRRRLLPEEETELRQLIQPRNQRIIDLLIARNTNGWSNVLIILNKGIQGIEGFNEEIHPFSDNGIAIYAPSSRGHNSTFGIKVKLSGLRRKGLVDSSTDAEVLLGEKSDAPETPENFMFRTRRELIEIDRLKNYGRQQAEDAQTTQAINHLDQLTATIIIDRFVELKRRGKIPSGFTVNFCALRSKIVSGETIAEATRIYLPNVSGQSFIVRGQRIGIALASLGFDYDS